MNQQSNTKGFSKYPISATDPRFPSFLQGFNQRWQAGFCEVVYVCYSPQGVAVALEEAISLYGKNVKIKSGGHCYENFVFSAKTKAIIDVSAMSDCGYDPEKGYYLDSGGTNWSAFNSLFRDYGKVLPAGSCYSVGLGGHICGGGYGLLSRLNGLTVDWLTGVEVVVKPNPEEPASVIYVSKESEDPDEQNLFWGHQGGGGGNFGVITRYYFKDLPDSPVSAFITQLSIDWSELTPEILDAVLTRFTAIAEGSDNWRQFGILALHHQAQGAIVMTIQTAVLKSENPEIIRQRYINNILEDLSGLVTYQLNTRPSATHLGGFAQPVAHTLSYTFYEAVQTLNGSGANQRGKYKSAYMRKGFPMYQIEAIYKYLTLVPQSLTPQDMTQCLLQVDTYGGEINTVSPTETAIPQRSSILKLQYQAYWTEEKDDHAFLDWMNEFYTTVYIETGGTPNPQLDPTDNVDGCYYNYPDSDLNAFGGLEGALQLYFGENLPRLKEVKKCWDPTDYFNSFQSIPAV
ncbi:BBE domain-containing protein [Fluviicola taffensis]|uniref:BBE domain-containing protein n=1 Tax=Fluviicola taffensis TaxID=191579 RepID=UPI003137872A